jgi:hypothetical protein
VSSTRDAPGPLVILHDAARSTEKSFARCLNRGMAPPQTRTLPLWRPWPSPVSWFHEERSLLPLLSRAAACTLEELVGSEFVPSRFS